MPLIMFKEEPGVEGDFWVYEVTPYRIILSTLIFLADVIELFTVQSKQKQLILMDSQQKLSDQINLHCNYLWYWGYGTHWMLMLIAQLFMVFTHVSNYRKLM